MPTKADLRPFHSPTLVCGQVKKEDGAILRRPLYFQRKPIFRLSYWTFRVNA